VSASVEQIPPEVASCETCRFGRVMWRKGDDYTYFSEGHYEHRPGKRASTHIICRRRPPVIVHECGPMQPGVTPDDWCGEHEARGQ
jgi:hypothetical protein